MAGRFEGVRVARASRAVGLLEVVRYELGHFEHRHLLLAAENLLEPIVGIDQAPVDRVLKLVLLDVRPDLARDLGARRGASGQRLPHGP